MSTFVEIGKTLAKQGLPLLGTLLGGPAGRAIGALIASTIDGNADDPDGMAQILAADPNALFKLRELESNNAVRFRDLVTQQAVAELQAETTQQGNVNTTMQGESRSEHWPQYSWRPYWGFISATAFGAVCWFICELAHDAIYGRSPEALAMIPQLVGSFTMLFGVPAAILGIASWHRGVQKRLLANTPEPERGTRG